MISQADRILITGCGGMLGEAVYHRFKNRAEIYATDIDCNEPWLTPLDITSPDHIRTLCNTLQPRAIINLAAMTDLELCERDPRRAYAVNANGVFYLTTEAHRRGIPFVHISTAGIFDGVQEYYSEDDADRVRPLNVYGKSKYWGERIARQYKKTILIRCGWMMGGGFRKDKKFIKKMLDVIAAGATEVCVVSDKAGTPSYTYDVAKAIYYLLDNSQYGLYHATCEGGATRVEVAQYLISLLNRSVDIRITPVCSDHFQDIYFACRPASERLLSDRLRNLYPDVVRDWKECLSEYIRSI